MPDIETRDNSYDGIWIWALMHFPSDEQMRRSYYAVQHAKLKLEGHTNSSTLEIETGLLDALIDAPAHRDLRNLVATTAKKGIVAGDFLASIFTMACFSAECKEPSIYKAVFIAQQYSKISSFGDGAPLPTGKTAIRKYFDEFRAVAHLWAAFRLYQAFPIRPPAEMLASPAAVREFLGIAALLQDFGCQFAAERSKSSAPLLDSSMVWRVSDDIKRLSPPWTGPSPWFIDTLSRYRARPTG